MFNRWRSPNASTVCLTKMTFLSFSAVESKCLSGRLGRRRSSFFKYCFNKLGTEFAQECCGCPKCCPAASNAPTPAVHDRELDSEDRSAARSLTRRSPNHTCAWPSHTRGPEEGHRLLHEHRTDRSTDA